MKLSKENKKIEEKTTRRLCCHDHDGMGGWEYDYYCEACDYNLSETSYYCPNCGCKFTETIDSNRHL